MKADMGLQRAACPTEKRKEAGVGPASLVLNVLGKGRPSPRPKPPKSFGLGFFGELFSDAADNLFGNGMPPL